MSVAYNNYIIRKFLSLNEKTKLLIGKGKYVFVEGYKNINFRQHKMILKTFAIIYFWLKK